MSNKNKNRLSFEAQLSRHPHDVSRRHASSFTTGQLRPQWWDLAQPGDKYYMNPSMFARLQLVARAFLGEVDINMKVFFVPLQMLYTPFGQVFAQTNDVLSSVYKSLGGVDTFPRLDTQASLDSTPNANFYLGRKECVGKEHARLLDDLLLNPYAVLSSGQRTIAQYTPPEGVTPIDQLMCFSPSVTPWALAAYQAIYQKAFRNDEFEKFDIQSYNFDQYWQSSEPFVNDHFLKMRYVQRPSDYFTKTRVSPIASFINKFNAGSASDSVIVGQNNGGAYSALLGKVSSWLAGSQFQTNSLIADGDDDPVEFGINNNTGTETSFTGYSIGSPAANGGSTPVANIRAAFALDKFLRVYGRAGKTYDDQILAHFGVKIPHDVKHDITEIASIHGKLQVEPVYSTATVGLDNASALGQVGGQGQVTISSKGEIKFVAPVHGVVMCVAYAVTKPRYYGTFDKLHLLSSRIDFPIPEFDNLGAQPLYSFEVNPQGLNLLNQRDGKEPSSSQRFGWQNRWQQFKEKYDTCSFTYAPADAFGMETAGTYVQENSFMPWILSRPAFTPSVVETDPDCTPRAIELWETPEALNSVMDTPYNGAWSNDYFAAPHLMMQTDPIITDFSMDARKVSWMSETGEPNL